MDSTTISGLQLSTSTSEGGLPTNWSGTITGTFTNLSNFTSGQSLGFNMFGSSSGPIAVSVVPEPSAALLGAIGFILLLRRRRVS